MLAATGAFFEKITEMQQEPHKPVQRKDAVMRLSSALDDLRRRSVAAQQTTEEASKLSVFQATKLRNIPSLEAAKKCALKILVVALYIGSGVLFYGNVEPWSYSDALYFSVTSMST